MNGGVCHVFVLNGRLRKCSGNCGAECKKSAAPGKEVSTIYCNPHDARVTVRKLESSMILSLRVLCQSVES
jgi:hypothetical protein